MGQVGPEPCWDRGQEEAEDGNGLWDRAGAVFALGDMEASGACGDNSAAAAPAEAPLVLSAILLSAAYCKAGRHSGNIAGTEGWVSGCKSEDRQEGGGKT